MKFICFRFKLSLLVCSHQFFCIVHSLLSLRAVQFLSYSYFCFPKRMRFTELWYINLYTSNEYSFWRKAGKKSTVYRILKDIVKYEVAALGCHMLISRTQNVNWEVWSLHTIQMRAAMIILDFTDILYMQRELTSSIGMILLKNITIFFRVTLRTISILLPIVTVGLNHWNNRRKK